MILAFELTFGDLSGSSGRRPASTGWNSDTELPRFVLPLLRERLKKVTAEPRVAPASVEIHGVAPFLSAASISAHEGACQI